MTVPNAVLARLIRAMVLAYESGLAGPGTSVG
jgi:hypothetical protein